MITQSGCFGKIRPVDLIDDTVEASELVGDIVDDVKPVETVDDVATPTVFTLSLVMQRLRMLTWAVVIIAAYLVLKESK